MTWLFDLDNTLHDASHAAYGLIDAAMNDYIERELQVAPDLADHLRRDYWRRYGATLLGLERHHGIRAAHFLEHTHRLPELEDRLRCHAHDRAALARLPGRKILLTNAPASYARRVLTAIISGGQTGVDGAALDVAMELGIPCGGWCPKGRRAEDGRIPDSYPLQEASSPDYPFRTRLNVEDSDGILILARGSPQGGTALTLKLARKLNKPLILVDLARKPEASDVQQWIQNNHVRILNVAGPREGESAGIFEKASAFLRLVLTTPPKK